MPKEFEGDLTGAVFWGADLTGARFRDVDLSGARISHAWLVDVEIDALVERVVINGVDVTAHVNERDPWYPLRAMIRRDTDRDGLRGAWAALEAEWAATIERARALPEAAPYESVGGEWSFVQTVRHLVFAMDMWFTAPVSGERLHPMGLPDSASADLPWPGLDLSLSPSLEEALVVRADRARHFRTFLDDLATADLDREVDVLGNGTNPLRECLFTVLEEEFWHLRYARRDLEHLERGTSASPPS